MLKTEEQIDEKLFQATSLRDMLESAKRNGVNLKDYELNLMGIKSKIDALLWVKGLNEQL